LRDKVLILGGTGFVGRILTENLLKSNYKITLFNRGKRNPGIFPEVKHLFGDRETDEIEQIASGDWDAVVDFSCMQPDNLNRILGLLEGKVERYIFISTASVYPLDNPSELKFPLTEDEEILPCSEEQRMTKDILSAYGNKKAECERILLGNKWMDAIIFRPAVIYGRYDPSDRFYYWLFRAKTQSEILIPEYGKSKATNTYSEDFAKILQEAIEIEKFSNVYNAVTHPPVSLKEIVETASGIMGTSPSFINAPLDFLREHKVTEWMDLPIWINDYDLVLNNSKLLNDYKTKPVSFEESVSKTIGYYDSLGWEEGRYGLKAEREKELIQKLNSQK
jgi:2'-hydroxyisoflavone reductase